MPNAQCPIFKENHKAISHFPNVAYNIVAIAASRGGLKAIGKILSALPADFPAAIVVVQHLSSKFPSYMAQILANRTSLRVKQAEEGELLRPGTVYTCVPDKHLIVKPDATLSFAYGPRYTLSALQLINCLSQLQLVLKVVRSQSFSQAKTAMAL